MEQGIEEIMQKRPSAGLGLVLVVIGLLLFAISGFVEVNASEEHGIKKTVGGNWESSHEARKIIDDNLFASWLKGFSQILILGGIGFILFEIAMGDIRT